MEPHASKVPIVLYIIIAVLAIGAVIYWFVTKPSEESISQVETPRANAPLEQNDLGSSLFEEAANPLSGELPDTFAPVQNPLEGLYQNPFE